MKLNTYDLKALKLEFLKIHDLIYSNKNQDFKQEPMKFNFIEEMRILFEFKKILGKYDYVQAPFSYQTDDNYLYSEGNKTRYLSGSSIVQEESPNLLNYFIEIIQSLDTDNWDRDNSK